MATITVNSLSTSNYNALLYQMLLNFGKRPLPTVWTATA